MYICRHFDIYELVPPHIYKEFGQRAWEFLDERLLRTIDKLRDDFGPININTYHWGGTRRWSGLRTPKSPYYSETSQHSSGRAADLLFTKIESEEVRQKILSNHLTDYPYITAMELGVSWVHIDCRNTNGIKIFYP